MVIVVIKPKEQKLYITKRRIKFNDYKTCLWNNKIISKSLQRLKTEAHNLYTE